MKALIIYFSMGGRTKKIADIIGSTLSNYAVNYCPFILTGAFPTKLDKLDKFDKGDFSYFQKELNILSTQEYDLLVIGMPTYGGVPPKIFYEIVRKLPHLSEKQIVMFSTSRGSKEGAKAHMQIEFEKIGGHILESRNFQKMIGLKIQDAVSFGQHINEIAKKE